MTLHNLTTTLTPAEHRALHNVVTHVLLPLKMKKEAAQAKGEDISGAELRLFESCEHASLWLAAQSEKFLESVPEIALKNHLPFFSTTAS